MEVYILIGFGVMFELAVLIACVWAIWHEEEWDELLFCLKLLLRRLYRSWQHNKKLRYSRKAKEAERRERAVNTAIYRG